MTLVDSDLDDETKATVYETEKSARNAYMDEIESVLTSLDNVSVVGMRYINANDDSDRTVYHTLTVVAKTEEAVRNVRDVMNETLLDEIEDKTHGADNSGLWLHYNWITIYHYIIYVRKDGDTYGTQWKSDTKRIVYDHIPLDASSLNTLATTLNPPHYFIGSQSEPR